MIHGTLAFLSILGVLPSSPWLHFKNEGVSLEWVKDVIQGGNFFNPLNTHIRV